MDYVWLGASIVLAVVVLILIGNARQRYRRYQRRHADEVWHDEASAENNALSAADDPPNPMTCTHVGSGHHQVCTICGKQLDPFMNC